MNRRFFLAAGAAALAGCSTGSTLPLPTPGRLPWNALAKELSGRVVLPGDAGFAALSLPNNLRFAARQPAGIALCKTARDVSASIRWARENGVPLVARSGGHSYAGYSTTTGLMIDVAAMTSFDFDAATSTITLGGGARNSTVLQGCKPLGIAIPHGRCFPVGVAGLALGGGVGFNMRANGLTSDTMVATEIVTADGTIRTVDAHDDPSLFWACRGGGGGNFGINTSFTFQAFRVSRLAACELWWDAQLEPVFAALVSALEPAADTLGSKISINLSRDRSGKPVARLQLLAQLEDSLQALKDVLQPAFDVRPPDRVGFFDERPYWDAQEELSEAGLPSYFLERSRFFNQRISDDAIDTVFRWCRRWPATTKGGTFKLFQTGGAMNAVAPAATAFVHRNSVWLGAMDVIWDAQTASADLHRAFAWLDGFYAAVVPIAGGGAYQNFIDPTLKNWQQAYYGDNLARLEEVKRRVDPSNVFTFPEAIPAQGTAPMRTRLQ